MLFFFHKNIIITCPQFFFGWVSAYSGQSYWDAWCMSGYNTFATSVAIGALSVWDQDIDIDNS